MKKLTLQTLLTAALIAAAHMPPAHAEILIDPVPVALTQPAKPITNYEARYALRTVRDRVRSGLYSLKGYSTTFGVTTVFLTLVHSLNPASVLRLISKHIGNMTTLGLGYWIAGTTEAQTGTLADPYLHGEEGMQAYLALPDERQQLALLGTDRRLLDAVIALGRRAIQLDQFYANAEMDATKTAPSLQN